MAADQALAQKYLDLLPTDVYSIGRMGTYRYFDIGNIIEQCFDLFREDRNSALTRIVSWRASN